MNDKDIRYTIDRNSIGHLDIFRELCYSQMR